jgi:hypothetical protein
MPDMRFQGASAAVGCTSTVHSFYSPDPIFKKYFLRAQPATSRPARTSRQDTRTHRPRGALISTTHHSGRALPDAGSPGLRPSFTGTIGRNIPCGTLRRRARAVLAREPRRRSTVSRNSASTSKSCISCRRSATPKLAAKSPIGRCPGVSTARSNSAKQLCLKLIRMAFALLPFSSPQSDSTTGD